MHDRAHEPGIESRGDVRISRGLRLRSLRLGLSGIADVVEFHRCGRPRRCKRERREAGRYWRCSSPRRFRVMGLLFLLSTSVDAPNPGRSTRFSYARRPSAWKKCSVSPVPSAALFYGKPVRRFEVALTASLREETERLAIRAPRIDAFGCHSASDLRKESATAARYSLCACRGVCRNTALSKTTLPRPLTSANG